MPPPLVHYATEDEYRHYYEVHYGGAVIKTFDGIRVFFPKPQFDHAFFQSANRQARDKSLFSYRRAERIGWILAALQDSTADLFAGWDHDRKTCDFSRRVVVAFGDYVVVLRVSTKRAEATFITAYVADIAMIQKIRSGPRWL